MSTPEDLHRQLGLTDEEYERIEGILEREPNRAELAMFSVMWSEHCSYKSSRIHLKTLPSEGPDILVGPGEGAGIVKVGDLAVALRLESHNHPSFVEPFQGAATGIGGVVRDVLSVGARPIALFDPLRFGPLPVEGRVPQTVGERNRFLVEGVVSGISSYGNCIGVPTVGGEVKFEDCYSGNPLVNVMCIGVAPVERIHHARADGPGNKVLLLGSKTGRDGIGGVSVLASASFGDDDADKRPSVQVGDPFTEKLLIEACLELMEAGLVVGIQDLGGAGLSCATSESAANAGNGMKVNLEAVPRREQGMEPFEVLISESQERMLVIVEEKDAERALSICDKWGLAASVIGEVAAGGRLEVTDNGSIIADVPAASLGDGPIYDRPIQAPHWIEDLARQEVGASPPDDLGKTLLELLAAPNIASKSWVWEQFDHQVMLGTVVTPGHDAAVIRLPSSSERIAVSTDGNGRYCYLDPFLGAQHAVAEAYRNVSAVGARPIAITNCLNFGNPERPEVMWQFAESVRGMGEACMALGTPVTGGNVSFYNETSGSAIYPTPVVGMVGVMPRDVIPPPIGFQNEGDVIALVGMTSDDLGGGEYARTILGKIGGRVPRLDLGTEATNGTVVRRLIELGLVSSTHDCSEGGIGVTVAESCIAGGIGASLELDDELAPHVWLFSESPSRYVISYPESRSDEVIELVAGSNGHIARIGAVGGNELIWGPEIRLDLETLTATYKRSFAEAMGYAR
ncbi:MAG: phosphoribosylformylglycinamidine synthase subunit PurL [Actinobacteria bacterium]|nr:phosphoribosylformylglycinamidine synthase subunit PurL [Actinomycetota bacterium]